MANTATWTQILPPEEEKPEETQDAGAGDNGEEKKEVKPKKQPKQVEFHIGDTVRVHYRLIERETEAGNKKREVKVTVRERAQVFEGIVISIKGRGSNRMFTVRKIGTQAIGVERIFPIISPWILDFEVKRYGQARRSKLYYLRDRIGKAATRVKEAKQRKVAKASA